MAASKVTKPRLCVSTVGILSLTGKTRTRPGMHMKSKLKAFSSLILFLSGVAGVAAVAFS